MAVRLWRGMSERFKICVHLSYEQNATINHPLAQEIDRPFLDPIKLLIPLNYIDFLIPLPAKTVIKTPLGGEGGRRRADDPF